MFVVYHRLDADLSSSCASCCWYPLKRGVLHEICEKTEPGEGEAPQWNSAMNPRTTELSGVESEGIEIAAGLKKIDISTVTQTRFRKE